MTRLSRALRTFAISLPPALLGAWAGAKWSQYIFWPAVAFLIALPLAFAARVAWVVFRNARAPQ